MAISAQRPSTSTFRLVEHLSCQQLFRASSFSTAPGGLAGQLTELLSDPKFSSEVSQTLSELPLIEVTHDYWQRAGELRAKVLAMRQKARLRDALIAQSCIDRGIPLLTRDRDFRAFADAAGLDLLIGFAAD